MKRYLMIVPTKGFSDEDVFNFFDIIKEKIYIATKDRNIAIGIYGSQIYPDFSIDEVFKMRENPFDSLVLVADKGYKELLDTEVKSLFVRFLFSGKPIILSSLAQVGIAKMKLLIDKFITYDIDNYPKYQFILSKYGVKVVNQPYYIDGNIITTKGKDYIYELLEVLNASD